MAKVIIDRKDDKFIVAVTPLMEQVFVIDQIEISEEAKNVIFEKEGGQSLVEQFTREWYKRVYNEY